MQEQPSSAVRSREPPAVSRGDHFFLAGKYFFSMDATTT
jgi:hypothetical protein